jgi:hypothetical protein
VDADREHETFGLDEQMAFAALDPLAAVVAPLPADTVGLDRLAVDTARTGLWSTPQPDAQALAQHQVDPFPGAVQAPLSKVVKDRLPGGQVAGQQPPGTATTHEIEDRVEDAAQRVPTGASAPRRRRYQRLQYCPLRFRHIAAVYEGIHASQRIRSGRVPDLSDGY